MALKIKRGERAREFERVTEITQGGFKAGRKIFERERREGEKKEDPLGNVGKQRCRVPVHEQRGVCAVARFLARACIEA